MKKALFMLAILCMINIVQAQTFPVYSTWQGETNGSTVHWSLIAENKVDAFSLTDYSLTNKKSRYHLEFLRDSGNINYISIVYSSSNNAKMDLYKVTKFTEQDLHLELLLKYHPPVVWHKATPFTWTPVTIHLKRKN